MSSAPTTPLSATPGYTTVSASSRDAVLTTELDNIKSQNRSNNNNNNNDSEPPQDGRFRDVDGIMFDPDIAKGLLMIPLTGPQRRHRTSYIWRYGFLAMDRQSRKQYWVCKLCHSAGRHKAFQTTTTSHPNKHLRRHVFDTREDSENSRRTPDIPLMSAATARSFRSADDDEYRFIAYRPGFNGIPSPTSPPSRSMPAPVSAPRAGFATRPATAAAAAAYSTPPRREAIAIPDEDSTVARQLAVAAKGDGSGQSYGSGAPQQPQQKQQQQEPPPQQQQLRAQWEQLLDFVYTQKEDADADAELQRMFGELGRLAKDGDEEAFRRKKVQIRSYVMW